MGCPLLPQLLGGAKAPPDREARKARTLCRFDIDLGISDIGSPRRRIAKLRKGKKIYHKAILA